MNCQQQDINSSGEPEDLKYCVEILTGGYVQSFVDFFYLIHKKSDDEENEESNPVSIRTSVEESKDPSEDEQQGNKHLEFVRDKLTGAEKARRSGAPNLVYQHYLELAGYFCSTGEFQTATCFYEKCLKISQLVNDGEGEKVALFELGLALQQVPGEMEKAIHYHEKHMGLAEKTHDEEAASKARKQLASVYEKRASELEKSKDPKELAQVVELLESCVRIFAEENDLKGKALASFRLGCAFNALNKPDRAIVALSQNFDYCEKSGDVKGQGKACASLAAAYLQVENKAQKAVEYLEECLSIAQQTDDTNMQAFASRSLGSVHTKLGEHDKAVHYFEQNFELRKKQETKLKEIDKARVLLGLALQNARQEELYKMTNSDLFGLLNWKTARDFSFSSSN